MIAETESIGDDYDHMACHDITWIERLQQHGRRLLRGRLARVRKAGAVVVVRAQREEQLGRPAPVDDSLDVVEQPPSFAMELQWRRAVWEAKG